MLKPSLRNGVVITLLLCSVMALALLSPSLKRGLFFREDYLPYLATLAGLFALVSVIAILKRDTIWRGDIDILLILIVALYFLTTIWAQSRMDAVDGALKYAGYLMVFVIARYAGSSGLGNRILRNLLVASGVVAASVGYLTASGLAYFPAAVQSGALLGSFQYPNALAAFAMFTLIFLYHAWYEGFKNPWLDVGAGVLYSASAFLLVGAVLLTDSRTTLLMFGVFMALYLALLPRGDRARIAMRVAVSIISFAPVASRLDAALNKSDTASMRQGLAIGLGLAAVLEVARWLWDTRVTRLASAASGVSATASNTAPAEPSFRVVLSRALVVVLVAAIASVGLIAAAKNPSTAKALSGILSQRVINQLKTLGLTDLSLLIRLMATKDALSIALDFPFGAGAGGWDALYHQYHTTPYWFTETHNHFAQVLVEIGFPGLALYVVFWGVLAYAAIKRYLTLMSRPADAAAHGNLVGVTSSAVAVFALGIHSAADFDLSLPAIAVALFTAIGVLVSGISEALPRMPRFGAIAKWSRVATALLAAVLVPTVVSTANRLYKGVVYGSEGVRAAISGDEVLSRRYFAEAVKRDKWNSTYEMDMALLAVNKFRASGDPAVRGMVPQYLQAAKAADPTNLSRQVKESKLLQEIGMIDDSVKAAYEAVLMMPTNRDYHEALGDLGRVSILEHVKALVRDDISVTDREEHMDRLSDCVRLLTSASDILEAKRERVIGIYAVLFDPKGLDPTPKIALAAGEAAFLTGDMEVSAAFLAAAAKHKDLAQEANTWLAYLAEATGFEAALPAGFQPSLGETHRMASLFGAVDRVE